MNHLPLQYFQGGTAFFHIFKNEFRKNDFEAATETFFSERLCFLEWLAFIVQFSVIWGSNNINKLNYEGLLFTIAIMSRAKKVPFLFQVISLL